MKLRSFASLVGRLSLALALLAPLAFAGALAATARPGDEVPVDFAALAARFRADHGLAAGAVGVDQVFVPLRLGAVSLELPRASLAADPEPLRRGALAVCDLQAKWLEWMEPVIGPAKAEKKDLATVRKWLDGWKPRAELGPEPDLYVAAGAPGEVREAAARLASAADEGLLVGHPLADPAPAQVALLPTRRDFVGFLAYLGEDPALRQYYWVEGMPRWMMSFTEDLQIVPLQYVDPGRPDGATEQGQSLDARSTTGLEEHVAQLTANSLFERLFGPRVPEAFAQGLGMDLVIDVYGELTTRLDGDLRERFTAPQERFIPGAPSAGGTLPPMSAESRWRERQGADRFVTALQRALDQGTEELRRKGHMAFALLNDDGGGAHLLPVPILGPGGAKEAPPDEFQGDWLEFLRAYKAGFVYWLRTAGARTEKKSAERFAELLSRLSRADEKADFDAIFAELYEGLSISADEPGQKTLEGRFLTWLAKHK